MREIQSSALNSIVKEKQFEPMLSLAQICIEMREQNYPVDRNEKKNVRAKIMTASEPALEEKRIEDI